MYASIVSRQGPGWDTDDDGEAEIYCIIDEGTVTITEFNLIDKVIRGTFEFTYKRYFEDTGQVTGPYNCLNGTFDYSLDHPRFF